MEASQRPGGFREPMLRGRWWSHRMRGSIDRCNSDHLDPRTPPWRSKVGARQEAQYTTSDPLDLRLKPKHRRRFGQPHSQCFTGRMDEAKVYEGEAEEHMTYRKGTWLHASSTKAQLVRGSPAACSPCIVLGVEGFGSVWDALSSAGSELICSGQMFDAVAPAISTHSRHHVQPCDFCASPDPLTVTQCMLAPCLCFDSTVFMSQIEPPGYKCHCWSGSVVCYHQCTVFHSLHAVVLVHCEVQTPAIVKKQQQQCELWTHMTATHSEHGSVADHNCSVRVGSQN